MDHLAYIFRHIIHEDLRDLFDQADAIKDAISGAGCGMTRGGFVDKLFIEQLSNHEFFTENRIGQADVSFYGRAYSLKTITSGGTAIALSWSKNPNIIERKFDHDVILLNLYGAKWTRTTFFDRGIYILSKDYANEHVTLTSNNKSDHVVPKNQLLDLLAHAIQMERFIPLEPVNTYTWSIKNGIRLKM